MCGTHKWGRVQQFNTAARVYAMSTAHGSLPTSVNMGGERERERERERREGRERERERERKKMPEPHTNYGTERIRKLREQTISTGGANRENFLKIKIQTLSRK